MNRTILVTGATGTIGRRLAGRLARFSGLEVRVLVRNPTLAADLAEHGSELHPGTFEDPASLGEAVRGVDTVVLVTPAAERAAEHARAVLDHARRAGVRKIVRLSAIKASAEGPTDNTRQHARTEREIEASGLAFVALRPQFFMQNLLGGAAAVVQHGTLYSGTGDARIGMIDCRDVVDCLEQAVLRPDFDGRAFELTGPEAITHDTAAETLSRAIGRPVEHTRLTPEAAAESMRGLGADDWTVRLVADYMRAYRDGFGDFVTDHVRAMTGHPARSLATFAAEEFAPLAEQLEGAAE